MLELRSIIGPLVLDVRSSGGDLQNDKSFIIFNEEYIFHRQLQYQDKNLQAKFLLWLVFIYSSQNDVCGAALSVYPH